MQINFYQIWYDQASKPAKESGIKPFDCRYNPEYLKREVAHLIRFYDDVVQYADDDNYFALLSPKFSDKTKLCIDQVQQFITANPDRDIYLFNPFPILPYCNLNVWEHGESMHNGLIDLTQFLLNNAKIEFNITHKHRNNINTTVYCNYWVASKKFLDAYIPFLKHLDATIERMSEVDKNKFFATATYHTHASFYPFIFERIICLFLNMNKQYKVKPYIYQDDSDIFKTSKSIVRKFFKYQYNHFFNDWESRIEDINTIDNGIDIIQSTLKPQIKIFHFRPLDKIAESIYKKIRLPMLKRLLYQIETSSHSLNRDSFNNLGNNFDNNLGNHSNHPEE